MRPMLLGLNLDCPGHGTQGIFGTVGLVVTTRLNGQKQQKDIEVVIAQAQK